MKFLRKAMALSLAVLLLISMFPVSAGADCVEGCADGFHATGCDQAPPPVVPCSKSAGCTADTHDADCYVVLLRSCNGETTCPSTVHQSSCKLVLLSQCTRNVGCGASLHHDDCAHPVYMAKLALCDRSTGCTAEVHHNDCQFFILSQCTRKADCANSLHHSDCEKQIYLDKLALCGKAIDCAAEVHHSDCQFFILSQCTRKADCANSLHHSDCEKQIYLDKLALCGKAIDCTAEVHHSDCQFFILTQCTRKADCANSLHYDDCQKQLDDAERTLCTEAADCLRRVHKVSCRALCDTSANCPAQAHKDTCIKLCTQAETCPAKTHYTDCLTRCTTALDCPASAHKGGCQKAAADAAKAAAIQAELNAMLEAMGPWLNKTILTRAEYTAFEKEWLAANKFAQDNGVTPNETQQDLFSRLGNHLTTVTTDVTLSFYDGSTTVNVTGTYGDAVTGLPKNPTKAGHTFVCWVDAVTKKEATLPAKFPDKNVAYEAKWSINKYTILIDTAGGLPVPAPITANYGTPLSITQPIRVGYTFVKWVDEKGATATIPATMPDKDMMLRAVWNPIKYKVSFDPSIPGYTGTGMDPETIQYDSVFRLPACAFTPANSATRFAGWSTAPGGTVQYPDTATIKNLAPVEGAEITLYAVWTDQKVLTPNLNVKTTAEYDGAPKTFAFETGYKIEYLVNGAFTTTAPSDAGSYDIKVSAEENKETNTAAFKAIIHDGLVITPAILTATYISETVYAGYAPKLQVTVTGFKGGENASNLGNTYIAPIVYAPSTVGKHTLTPYGGYAKNYAFQYVSGTLTIKEKVVYVYDSNKLLQTGQLNWPVPVMGAAGTAAVALSLWLLLRKKKERYE